MSWQNSYKLIVARLYEMLSSLLTLFLCLQTANSRHLSLKEEIDISIDETIPTMNQEWIEFREKYNKQYSEKEAEFRFEIFKNNYEMIREHNLRYDRGEVSYYLAINKFADLDEKEFSAAYKGLNMNEIKKVGQKQNFFLNEKDLPAEVDWRKKHVVTPVKDQENCGSCYAFSAVGSIEGQFALMNHTLVSFSEQNLVDCSTVYGNNGCGGGTMENCYLYVYNNEGLDTEAQYPYHAKQGTCKYKKNPLSLIGYVNSQTRDELSLQHASATGGPMSVAVDVTNHFQLYGGGILDDHTCTQDHLNHGVLLVGYGVDNDTDYWLVKNSWGSDWGLSGYIKMSRNKGNQCGIATDATYPILKYNI